MDELERAATDLQLPAVGDEADWLGRLDKVLRKLRDKRKTVLDELDGPTAGEAYRVAENRSASRSYNTAGLLSSFADKGWTLQDLTRADAVRLSWRWTELKRAATQADVTLSVAQHEIGDDGDVDAPLVGEVWKSRYQVEGL